MKHLTLRTLLAFALVLAACGSNTNPDAVDDGGDAVSSPQTTTTLPSTTSSTVVTTSSTAPSTSTSTSTSTTVAPSESIPVIELESLADDDPARIVAEAFATMEANPPSGIEGRIVFEGLVDAPVDPAQMSFSIAVDEASGDSSFSMNFSDMAGDDAGLPGLAGAMGEMSIIQIGERAYVRFPIFNALLGVSTPWISMPADEQSTTHDVTPVTPSDPQAIFEAFEVGDATVDRIGDETVDGIATEHFRLVMDVEAMRDRAEDAASFDEALPATSGTVPMDVWIDRDGRVAQLAMTVDGDQTDSADEFDSMTMSMRFLGHGEPVEISPPPADQVTDIEDAEGFSLDG